MFIRFESIKRGISLSFLLTTIMVVPAGAAGPGEDPVVPDQDPLNYDELCGTSPNAGITHQRKEYCDAYNVEKKNKEGSNYRMLLWGATSAVCGTACAISLTPGVVASETFLDVCGWSNIAATAGDVVIALAIQKDMQKTVEILGENIAFLALGATMGQAGVGFLAPDLATNAAGHVTTEAAASAKNFSCINAGKAITMTLLAGIGKNQAEDAMAQALASAASLQSEVPNFEGGTAPQTIPDNGGMSMLAGGQSNISTAESAGASCSTQQSSGDIGAFTSCALAFDSGLPPQLRNPDLQQAFEEAAGLPLGDFISSVPSNASGAEVLGAALGAKNGTADAVTAELNTLEGNILANLSKQGQATYAATGGGRSSKSSEDSIGDVVKDLFNKIAPDAQKKEKEKPAVNSIAFQMNRRSADQIARDRSLSLFARVGFRYQQTQPRLASIPWSSRYNRVVAGTRSTGIETPEPQGRK